MKILGLLVLLIPVQAFSETWVDINIGSRHSNKFYYEYDNNLGMNVPIKYEESNFGLGLTHKLSKHVDGKLGLFNNSYGNRSIYTGVNFNYRSSKWVRPGVMVGAATGYSVPQEKTVAGLKPVILPNVAIGNDKFRVVVSHAPAIFGVETSITTLQLQVRMF